MRRFAIVAVLLGWAAGCATRPAVVRPAPVMAPPPPPPAPPPRKTKLAVLPVEKMVLPKVAEALNQRLSKASVTGSETTSASISMDMALLQVDCAQPSDECYGRIAKRLEADRLLWAEIEHRARAKKKAASPTTIRIVLYDVDRATVVGRAEETFSGPVPDEALDEMLTRATAEPTAAKVSP